MMNEVTRAKWSAGIAMLVVIGILILGSKVANAEMRVASTGIMKHIVVKDMRYGHMTFSYRTDKDGKLILMDTLVVYKGMAMTPKQYEEYVNLETQEKADVANAKALIKQWKLLEKQKAKLRATGTTYIVYKGVAMTIPQYNAKTLTLDQGQCNNPLTIAP